MFNKVNIDIRKLRDYCLNPNHPVGKHKARVFYDHLGLTRNDAGKLKDEISEKIKKARVHTEYEDKFGKRYSAVIDLDIKTNTASVKTVWIVRSGKEIPELVTCYVIT